MENICGLLLLLFSLYYYRLLLPYRHKIPKETKMASSNIVQVVDSAFDEEVMESEVPVLVDFWAPWCGPCRALSPVIEEISNDYEGSVKVGKVNVDENPQTTMKFRIRSIPTLIVFKNGEVAEQIVGAVPKSEIEKILDKTLD